MSSTKKLALVAIIALGAARTARADEPTAADQPAMTEQVEQAAEAARAHEPSEGDPTRGFNFTDLHSTGSPLGGPKAESAGGGESEGIPAPFLYLVGNFLLLLAILAWKAGPAARKAAEKRHDEIKKALEEAQAKVQADTEAARAQLLPQANALAKTMAARILGREIA